MKRTLGAMVAALLMVALVASGAFAATSKLTSVGTWKASIGPNYASTKSATTTGGAGVSFSTDSASYVDLLTTTQDKSLLGDLTGKTITATFTVTASSDAVHAYDLSGGNTCTPAVAFVRPYFKSNRGIELGRLNAVTNVGQIGLSFGGGCFFANGVGLSAGSASFLLTSYTVTP